MENLHANFNFKLSGLLSYLRRTKEEFEIVADEIEDCTLKTAFNGLSAESSQFEKELSMQMRALGITEPAISHSRPELNDADNEETDPECNKGDEVLKLCCNRENLITQAYKAVLSDHLPFPGLRAVMMYQLNSLKYAFMKIRLLNATRFS